MEASKGKSDPKQRNDANPDGEPYNVSNQSSFRSKGKKMSPSSNKSMKKIRSTHQFSDEKHAQITCQNRQIQVSPHPSGFVFPFALAESRPNINPRNWVPTNPPLFHHLSPLQNQPMISFAPHYFESSFHPQQQPLQYSSNKHISSPLGIATSTKVIQRSEATPLG